MESIKDLSPNDKIEKIDERLNHLEEKFPDLYKT